MRRFSAPQDSVFNFQVNITQGQEGRQPQFCAKTGAKILQGTAHCRKKLTVWAAGLLYAGRNGEIDLILHKDFRIGKLHIHAHLFDIPQNSVYMEQGGFPWYGGLLCFGHSLFDKFTAI